MTWTFINIFSIVGVNDTITSELKVAQSKIHLSEQDLANHKLTKQNANVCTKYIKSDTVKLHTVKYKPKQGYEEGPVLLPLVVHVEWSGLTDSTADRNLICVAW